MTMTTNALCFVTLAVAALGAVAAAGAAAGEVARCPGGSWSLVETLPPDLNLTRLGPSTYEAFAQALGDANTTVRFAALWASLDAPEYAASLPDAWHGAALNRTLVRLAARGVRVGVVTNDCTAPGHIFPCGPVQWWARHGVNVTLANWPRLAGSWGVQHAKILAVDGRHGYSGSANLGWSSFAQTKEAGVMFRDCPAVVDIYDRLIGMWRVAGAAGAVPAAYPPELLPRYSAARPLRVWLGASNETLEVAPCYSPPPLGYGAAADDCGAALPALIDAAARSVQVTLMDYSPASLYDSHGVPPTYWDVLDAALRRAAFRGVRVSLLVSQWRMTFPVEQPYWASLGALANVTVRQFVMPATPSEARGARVNHPKYMVVDGAVAQVMTSNWSPDYYKWFGGLGLTLRGGTVAATFQRAFQRDWSSPYAEALPARA